MTECWPDFPPPPQEKKPTDEKLKTHFHSDSPLAQLDRALASNRAWRKAKEEREAREAAERNRLGPGFTDL